MVYTPHQPDSDKGITSAAVFQTSNTAESNIPLHDTITALPSLLLLLYLSPLLHALSAYLAHIPFMCCNSPAPPFTQQQHDLSAVTYCSCWSDK